MGIMNEKMILGFFEKKQFLWIVLIYICLNFSFAGEFKEVENLVDLGDGYDTAIIAKPSKSSFESIGHWKYLRYKEKEICHLGPCSVSPDGGFIAYQEASKGKIFFLDKKEHKQIELVSKFPGLVREFDWEVKSGYLKIEIYDKDALILPFPKKDEFKELSKFSDADPTDNIIEERGKGI